MLLAHAGNRIDADDREEPRFPTSQVDHVTDVLARLLASLQPSAVVSAPANGGDLIVLTEAQRLGIATHVVLPLPVRDFCVRSVEASSPRWAESYDRVLDLAATTPGSSVETMDLGEDPAWYLAANGLILDIARRHAGAEPVVAVTVRPPEGEDPPSVTDDFARRAMAAGLTVLTVDPRPAGAGGVLVS